MASAIESSQTELLDFGRSQEVQNGDVEPEPPEATSLPPVDGGRAAWLFLAGSFCIETLIWGADRYRTSNQGDGVNYAPGFPFSFGVLQDYYLTHPPLSQDANGISAIGTTCSVGIDPSSNFVALPLTSQGVVVSWGTTCVSRLSTMAAAPTA
jgi:hypothetical protein